MLERRALEIKCPWARSLIQDRRGALKRGVRFLMPSLRAGGPFVLHGPDPGRDERYGPRRVRLRTVPAREEWIERCCILFPLAMTRSTETWSRGRGAAAQAARVLQRHVHPRSVAEADGAEAMEVEEEGVPEGKADVHIKMVVD